MAGTGAGRVRKLPSVYVNDVQVYADRDVAAVQRVLRRAVRAFTSSHEKATYMLTGCEIGGRRGLYGTDSFNRSPYRRRLERLGMRFSRDPFVVLHEDGTFQSEDGAAFEAAFLTLPPTAEGVVRLDGAVLLHQLVFYRIADVAAEELTRLAGVAARLDAVAAPDADALAAALGA